VPPLVEEDPPELLLREPLPADVVAVAFFTRASAAATAAGAPATLSLLLLSSMVRGNSALTSVFPLKQETITQLPFGSRGSVMVSRGS
jgi:hypothetical protein